MITCEIAHRKHLPQDSLVSFSRSPRYRADKDEMYIVTHTPLLVYLYFWHHVEVHMGWKWWHIDHFYCFAVNCAFYASKTSEALFKYTILIALIGVMCYSDCCFTGLSHVLTSTNSKEKRKKMLRKGNHYKYNRAQFSLIMLGGRVQPKSAAGRKLLGSSRGLDNL